MEQLKILYLEDSEHDAEIVGRTLKNAGIRFEFHLVDTQEEYQQALDVYNPNLILADHSLFQFNSSEALKLFKKTNLKIPFILVTGTVSEEFAVKILKEGADDYLLKSNLTRLPSAILNSLTKYQLERDRQAFLDKIIANESLMKEAEKMAHFGSWQTDLVSGRTSWSDEAFRIYGYEPGEIEPDYDLFLSHIHRDDFSSLKEKLDLVVDAPGYHEFEFRIVDKNKIVKDIYSKITAHRNADGQPIRFVGFTQDITDRKDAEKKLLRSFQEVAALEKNIVQTQLKHQKLITEVAIQAQEKERNELAVELHDNINQLLATIKLYIGMIRTREQTPLDLVNKCHEYITEAMKEIRKLTHSLAAPTLGDIGLKDALQQLIADVMLASDLSIRLEVELNENEPLDKNIKLMIYRIVQEQINNIIKHAHAETVHILLKQEPSFLFLCVSDDGVGFKPGIKTHGVGLKSISSRVEFYSGQFEIHSNPGDGCALEIRIPVDQVPD